MSLSEDKRKYAKLLAQSLGVEYRDMNKSAFDRLPLAMLKGVALAAHGDPDELSGNTLMTNSENAQAVVDSLMALYEDGGIEAVKNATVPEGTEDVQEVMVEKLKASEKRKWAEALAETGDYDAAELKRASYPVVRKLAKSVRPELVHGDGPTETEPSTNTKLDRKNRAVISHGDDESTGGMPALSTRDRMKERGETDD